MGQNDQRIIGTWNRQLVCSLVRTEVLENGLTVVLHLAPDHKADTRGAIKVARKLAPNVRLIHCCNPQPEFFIVCVDGEWRGRHVPLDRRV